ncbi:MAG TPA: sigma 54-interacting transcriptional regulator [Verrucomicrobiae bacterium]
MKRKSPKKEAKQPAVAPYDESLNASPERAAELLRAILLGTAAATGAQFFRALVRHLAEGFHVRFSFVGECLPNLRSRSLAYFQDGRFGKDFEYDLTGTPCMEVVQGRVCHVPDNLAESFPQDKEVNDLGIVSYLGVPLRGADGQIIGHLVIFDDKPMPSDPLALSVMEAFAARAAAELERERAFKDLERRNEESDERYRDLFEEAPIAYVYEGLDSKFIRANRAAMRILGIKPEEVKSTYGKSFIPDTPEAQKRAREALEAAGRGVDSSGIVLELRRKDNGKPIWIQWWSKPGASGQYTRTMFVDITDRVLMEREKARLEVQNTYLQEEIRSEFNFGEILGNHPKLRETLRKVEQVAPTDSTVLIYGETGTGKELIARAIHDQSPRKNRALVKVNCGAISAGLVESELFGHVKGAFTGAISSRDGRFKVADGGTIFLDEVGELPMDTQVKLLRVLQEQEFEPIGSSMTIKVNVRVVAATNRDLEGWVREGKFRADLFYRLNVVPLPVPPLRERGSDLRLLVAFFVQKCAKKLGKQITSVSEETMRRLANYDWPGNVRELQNVIERAVILSTGNTLVLTEKLHPSSTFGRRHGEIQSLPLESQNIGALEEMTRRHIESVLKGTNWMIEGDRGAAKTLNMNPSTLRSRMQKLGIKRPEKSL